MSAATSSTATGRPPDASFGEPSGPTTSQETRQTWSGIARVYATYTSPFRPCREDIQLVECAVRRWQDEHPRVEMRALLLGVTPDLATLDWPQTSILIAIDNSKPVIDAIWPGDIPRRRRAVCGNWLSLPLRGPFDVVVGDGCLTAFRYVDELRAFLRAIRAVVRSGSTVILRCFVKAEPLEEPHEIVREMLEKRVPDVNHFKFRFLQAMQQSTSAGTAVNQAHEFLFTRVERATLHAMPAWDAAAVDAFDLWCGSDTIYTFPTLRELTELIHELFDDVSVVIPKYELGGKCPTLVLRIGSQSA